MDCTSDGPLHCNHTYSSEYQMAQQPLQKRILIPIPGSRGDVLPFLALALSLNSQYGHTVCLGVSPQQQTWMLSFKGKVDYFIMEPDPLQMMLDARKTPQGKTFFGPTAVPSYAQYRYFKQHFGHIFESFFDSTMQAGLNFKPDLVILPLFGQAISPAICEKLKVPFINVHFYPSLETNEFPPPEQSQGSAFEDSWISKIFLNLVSWKVFYWPVWYGIIRPVVNRKRAQLGLPVFQGDNDSPMKFCLKDNVPFVYLFSPQIVPKPHSWPSCVKIVGNIGMNPDSDELVSPETVLGKFLIQHHVIGPNVREHAKVFYIGFGSMVAILDDEEQVSLFRLIIKGFSDVYQQYPDVCVVLSVTHLKETQIADVREFSIQLRCDKNVLLIDGGVKHSALFPICSGIVHHGGAGTTHTAAFAGSPQLIIPFGNFDQAFWGGRIAKLNSGLRPIFVKKLTSADITRCLKEFVTNRSLGESASKLAASMKNEDGLSSFAAVVQEELKNDNYRGTLSSHLEQGGSFQKSQNWSVYFVCIILLISILTKIFLY
jgi:sterol 3beta-glucosyltransferase